MADNSNSHTNGCRSPCWLGGIAVYEKHGSEHMRRIGEKGRATIRERYGLRFYSEIAHRKRRASANKTSEGAA